MTPVEALIAAELRRQGVRAVFTLMSEDTARLIVEIDRIGLPLYSTRHDSTAVGMADGFARVSGEVGVAIVGRGPGLTNALNTLVTAARAGTGLVVLVGDSPIGLVDPARARAVRAERVGKHVEQAPLLDAVGVANVTLRDPATAIAELAACFERARAGGVVTVNLPADVLEAAVPAADLASPAGPPPPVPPSDADIALVADLLGESWAARHPLIVAGRGAVVAGAGPELRRLGELTGALLASTLVANGFFRADPYDVGMAGTMSTPLGGELIARADVVLAFGASLNPYTTYRGDLFRNARVVQFDADAGAMGRYLAVDVPVVGDARLAAAALVAELERRGHRAAGYRTPEVAGRLQGPEADVLPAGDAGGGLDPRLVMRELDRLLPAERNLVIDAGHHFEFSAAHIRVPEPRAFVLNNEYFSVGVGLAAALGAAVARPDRLTVLDAGDGGLMMNLGDLDTAVRYRLPLVVVVCNDGGFGSEVHYLRVKGLPDATARYENPSFAAVAEGLGARGITVDTLDQLAAVPEALEGLAGPLVIDCRITTEVRANWVDFLFQPDPAGSPTRPG